MRISTEPLPTLPVRAREIADALAAEGAAGWIVGETALEHALGRTPRVLALATSASADQVFATFPRAVPIRPDARSVLVPAGGVPVHIMPLQGDTPERALLSLLESQPFTALAIAWSPTGEAWVDAFGGLADLERNRLRSVGPPKAVAERDGLVTLRAARLSATHGLDLDPALQRALPDGLAKLKRLPAARLTTEWRSLMLADGVDQGVTVLEQAGFRRAWLGEDEPPRLAPLGRLPADFELRVCAWLSGARPARLLRRLRVDPRSAERIVRLCTHHPIEANQTTVRPKSIRRLLARLGQSDFEALVALRRLELKNEAGVQADGSAGDRLDELERTARNLMQPGQPRPKLAISGRDLLRELGLAPGPAIGALLDSLEEAVALGEVANEPGDLLRRARARAPGSAR